MRKSMIVGHAPAGSTILLGPTPFFAGGAADFARSKDWLLVFFTRGVDVYFTCNVKLSEWLLNSGAYMHWISAIPV